MLAQAGKRAARSPAKASQKREESTGPARRSGGRGMGNQRSHAYASASVMVGGASWTLAAHRMQPAAGSQDRPSAGRRTRTAPGSGALPPTPPAKRPRSEIFCGQLTAAMLTLTSCTRHTATKASHPHGKPTNQQTAGAQQARLHRAPISSSPRNTHVRPKTTHLVSASAVAAAPAHPT